MTRPTYRFTFGALLVCTLILARAPSAFATHLEAQNYTIDNFQASGACQGADRCWTSMTDAWYNEMDDHGFYSRDRRLVDDSLSAAFFCDPDTGGNCFDHLNIDEGDVAMIGTHGFDSGGHWRGLMRFQNTGDANCSIDAPEAGSGELFLGDADLEFLHLSSCNSMDDDNLGNTWRFFQDPVDSPASGKRLHQANGFHGVMFIFCNWGFRYEGFAADAFAGSIKDAWLSNMYVASVSVDTDGDMINETYEQCPVAYGVAPTFNECLTRLQNEQYDVVMTDPASIGAVCAYAFTGCDPFADNPFSFENPNP